MTSSTISAVNHNEPMDPPHPRADGPRRRRAFTASDKIAHLHAYEQACEHGEGGAYLRREGLYSSLISEWRKQRDAGVLAGKRPGEKVGQVPTAEQAEIARLTRELARANKRLHTTEAALDIMEKHTLSWSHCPRERTPTCSARSADRVLRNADRTWCIDKAGSHIDLGWSARPRLGGATPPRRSRPQSAPEPAVEPANKLTDAERAPGR